MFNPTCLRRVKVKTGAHPLGLFPVSSILWKSLEGSQNWGQPLWWRIITPLDGLMKVAEALALSWWVCVCFKAVFLIRQCACVSLAAAAAAKSLQSCPTLCDPTDGSPPGSPVPGILLARTLEWVAISFSNAWKWKVKVKSLSHVRLFTTNGDLVKMQILAQQLWKWGLRF